MARRDVQPVDPDVAGVTDRRHKPDIFALVDDDPVRLQYELLRGDGPPCAPKCNRIIAHADFLQPSQKRLVLLIGVAKGRSHLRIRIARGVARSGISNCDNTAIDPRGGGLCEPGVSTRYYLVTALIRPRKTTTVGGSREQTRSEGDQAKSCIRPGQSTGKSLQIGSR